VTPQELEAYLHQRIPLSLAMQVSVVEASMDHVLLRAPLAPNINHQNTVFGGSAASLATLAAWGLLHLRLAAEDFRSNLVVQRSNIAYEKAMAGEFMAKASAPSAEVWKSFIAMLQRKGRARISATAVLLYDGQEAGRLDGDFVALRVGAA